METILSKDKFIEKLKCQNKLYEDVLTIYENIVVPTIYQFNNKKFTLRLINAIRKKINDENMYISIEKEFSNNEIKIMKIDKSFDLCATLIIPIKILNGSINYDATINDILGSKFIAKYQMLIEENNYTIRNYDNFIEVVKNYEEQLKLYKNIPYQFRQNIVYNKICKL